MAEELYWIWLQEALGIGSVKVDRVLETVGTAKRFHEMDRPALQELGFLTKEEIARIQAASLDDARRLLERAQRLKCRVVTPEHPDYPVYFTHIQCKPCVLYVLGELSFPSLSLTLVGTRKSTKAGNDAAFMLGRDLAAAGCQVVSGLARGIDQNAHEGAVSVHGRTVGFLACGMNVDYPKDSNRLKRRILDEGGALATEFPFGMEPRPGHFHIRNRLMSGLSDGTVVIEAPGRSGALITAQCATDQNRDVFALPGSIMDPAMVGNNRLIQDGCQIVFDVYSILNAYQERLGEETLRQMTEAVEAAYSRMPRGAIRCAGSSRVNEPSSAAQEPSAAAREPSGAAQEPSAAVREPSGEILTPEQLEEMGLSPCARAVYGALEDEALDCDALYAKSGLAIAEMVAAVTELELCELIRQHPGKRYSRGV